MQITEEAKKRRKSHTHKLTLSRMNFFEIKTFKAKQLGVSKERKEKKEGRRKFLLIHTSTT